VLWAEFGDHSSGQAVVRQLEPGDDREIRLRILNSERSGRLVGRVFDRATGGPVAAAVVSVLGRPLEAESDRQGRFRLSGVPVVLPIKVAGIEVYKGPASLPAEFGGSDTRCGAIVIWTK